MAIDNLLSLIASANSAFIISLVVVGLAVLFLFGQLNFVSRQSAPALMVSLGIFGTFWGIFIALHPLDFAPENMNDSVVELLDGMTTAFATSLFGLASGFVSKFIWSLRRPGEIPPEPQQVVKLLQDIKQAIAGDGDSSLVTQMQKMREEHRDGFNKLDGLSDAIRNALVENLEKLMAEIREIIGKQLTEQLQQLITNIETALIKQFGTTFVEFNAATQALKQWQEDHRGQVEKLTEAFNLASRGIEKIRADCESIPQTMAKLKETIELADSQLDELNDRLRAFVEMKQQAEAAFPAIKERLEQISKDIQSGSDNLHQSMENAKSDVKTAIDSAAQNFNEAMQNEINRVTNQWGENLVGIAERCQEMIRQVETGRQNRPEDRDD